MSVCRRLGEVEEQCARDAGGAHVVDMIAWAFGSFLRTMRILYHNSQQNRKIDIPLAFQSDRCDNTCVLFLLVYDASVTGFMSGGMVGGTVLEVLGNYLMMRILDHPAIARMAK